MDVPGNSMYCSDVHGLLSANLKFFFNCEKHAGLQSCSKFHGIALYVHGSTMGTSMELLFRVWGITDRPLCTIYKSELEHL